MNKIVLGLVLCYAAASLSNSCPFDSTVSRCCAPQSTFNNSTRIISQCGCEGLGMPECTAPTLLGQCAWQSNAIAESICGALKTSKDCFANPSCNWQKPRNELPSCVALECGQLDCEDISALPNAETLCNLRADCSWGLFGNSTSCDTDYNCTCTNTSDPNAYCPCQKSQTACSATPGCAWASGINSCIAGARSSGFAAETSYWTIVIMGLLAIFAFNF